MNKDQPTSDEEEVDNGPNKVKPRPRPENGKKQERFSRGEIRSANELLSIKRPNNELIWPSPESKCKRIFNPLKQSNSENFSSSSKAKLQLKLLNTEHNTMVDLEKMKEDIP